jgi:hypothetical protein
MNDQHHTASPPDGSRRRDLRTHPATGGPLEAGLSRPCRSRRRHHRLPPIRGPRLAPDDPRSASTLEK